jgi:hypothetical protein
VQIIDFNAVFNGSIGGAAASMWGNKNEGRFAVNKAHPRRQGIFKFESHVGSISSSAL